MADDSRWRRVGGLAVAVLVIGVATAGCSDSTGGADPPPPTSVETRAPRKGEVIPSAAGPPGTPLGDGYEVVADTTLIGDPMPAGVVAVRAGVEVLDEGWVATSLIDDDGDPLEIIDAYLAQAVAAGLVAQPRPGCATADECVGVARSADRREPVSLTVTVVRGATQLATSNHVVVRLSTTDVYWDLATPISDAAIRPLAAAPQPPLASIGEPIAPPDPGAPAVVVQDGSRLAGPVFRPPGAGVPSWSAIVEVTGDADEVLDRYLASVGNPNDDDGYRRVREIGGARLTVANEGDPVGDHHSFVLVERPGRATWLAIDVYYA